MLLLSVCRAKLSGDCSKAFSDEGPLSVVFAILGGLPAAPNLARFRAQATVGLLDYHDCYYFYWSVNMFSLRRVLFCFGCPCWLFCVSSLKGHKDGQPSQSSSNSYPGQLIRFLFLCILEAK